MRTLILFTLLLFSYSGAQTAYDSLYLKSTYYKNLKAHFELSRAKKADIVFLGNSITQGGNWSELLGRERVVNRGIGGDNIPGMLDRLHQVYRLKPKICFIMAGINDLYTDAPVEEVFLRYMQLIDSLRIYKIIPVIQSTLHVNPKWKRAAEKNAEVAKLNEMIERYAGDISVPYINLNALLSNNGVLQDRYTSDGIHLTAQAYGVWRDALEPLLRSYGL
jgi:lysophospholipase L1-like esterase